MTHQEYVFVAYALAFAVMFAMAAKVWIASRSYRRQVEALAVVRRRPNREGL